MTDETDINWKSKMQGALLWFKVHPAFTIPFLTFIAGMTIGAWVF